MRPKVLSMVSILIRKPKGLLCALTTALLVTACGSLTATTDQDNIDSSSQQMGSSQKVTAHYPLTVQDQVGHTVTLLKLPQHIASTDLGLDEILSALVPKSNVSMVTAEALDPSRSNIVSYVKGIPQIQKVNTEVILSVEPELTLLAANTTSKDILDQLSEADITTYQFSEVHSIQNIEDNIHIIGKLVGTEGTADLLVQQMKQQINQIKSDMQNEKKLTVLDLSIMGATVGGTIRSAYNSSIWYTAGNGTIIDDLIEDAGGMDAAAQMKGWQKVTTKQILELDPDVILYRKSEAGVAQMLRENPDLQSVKAIQSKRIYAIPDAHLMSESQYIVKGIEDVASVLSPDIVVRTK